MASIRVYIPTQKPESINFVTESLKVLSLLYGGATAQYGYGSWVDGEVELVQEPVTICESFADTKLLYAELPTVEALCRRIKEGMGESSVLYTIQPGEATFI